MIINDQLSYEIFDKGKLESVRNISEINDVNRWVAETDNYFAVAGYGAFISGYFLIITKNPVLSFAHIDNKNNKELLYFRNFLKSYIKKNIKKT